MELSALLALLKSNGVLKYKDRELEIEISADSIDKPKMQEVEPPLPASMPPELKNPDLMTADQILNWSASPELGSGEQVAMTGDAPLDPELG